VLGAQFYCQIFYSASWQVENLDIIGMFQEGILLKNYSHYKIGGPARYFFSGENTDEIIKATEKAKHLKTPIFVLGGGTNILFGDDGFNGLILKPNIQFIKKSGNVLRVGAGVSVVELINYLIAEGLSGLEWLAGVPGTLGGATRGNAGAFGGEIKDNVKEVISLDISGRRVKIIKRNNQECDFDYRSSIFKKKDGKEIVLETILTLKKGDRKEMSADIEKNINYRRQNQPLEYPSIGSIFKNIDIKKVPKNRHKSLERVIKKDPFPVVPAAYLISEAGLKGVSCGGAMISPKHPNFIVNVLNATSNDVKNLIQLAKKEIKKTFSIELEEEITYLV